MRWLIWLGLITTPALAADYYVDPAGDDARDGSTPAKAWRTPARVEKQPLKPGDRVRLRAGAIHAGPLAIRYDGTDQKPIVVDSYIAGDAAPRALLQGGNICIDASASHLRVENIEFHNNAPDARAAVMIWAHRDLSDIEIRSCVFIDSAGRGIWIAGEKGKAAANIVIARNRFQNTAGSPIQVAKFAGGSIEHNSFTGNCSKPIDAWQAAIRVWSEDVHDLRIANNHIANGLHGLEHGAGMGIHVDEVGPNVIVKDNDVFDCDASGIEVENTRGVRVENNLIDNAHTGIFVYRAGHDHLIANNTVVARALGIVLQGHRAGGVNAGPEIEVNGKLVAGNRIVRNIAIARQWASLKITGGAEEGKNDLDANHFGADRASMFEWGGREFNSLATFEAAAGATRSVKEQLPVKMITDRSIPTSPADQNLGAKRRNDN